MMTIYDKLNMFLDAEGFGATPAVVNLGIVDYGKGESIKISINCGGADCVGLSAISVLTGATSSPATVVLTVPCIAAQVDGKVFSFTLTPDQGLLQYLTIALTDISAGTLITAGIVKDAQTNE